MSVILLLGCLSILCSFVLSHSRLLNCLMVVENFNVLLLFSSVLCQSGESHMFFLVLMVIFTIEVVLGLIVLTRLWDTSGLMCIAGI